MQVKYRIELPLLMKELKLPMIAVEIGVAEGNNSNDLIEHGVETMYSVDAWKTLNQRGDGGYEQSWHDMNYNKAVKLLSKHKEKSIIIKGVSHEVAETFEDESIGMIYLDGDHSYEGVMKDLEAWYPKVVKGGIIAGHDYLSQDYGVNRAVREFAKANKVFEVLTIPEKKTVDAGFYFKKPC